MSVGMSSILKVIVRYKAVLYSTKTFVVETSYNSNLLLSFILLCKLLDITSDTSLPPSPQDAFLPLGYPDSVSKDYLSYQMWDTVQVRGAKGGTLAFIRHNV